MSDDKPELGSSDEAPEDGETSGTAAGSGAVATRPLRPSGKRTRRASAEPEELLEASDGTEEASAADDDKPVKKPKAKKAAKDGAKFNPFTFVWNYLTQVVAELRKVIWPNRKQMVTYTSVVLVFLAFMVALIGFADLGLAELVSLVFG